VPSGFLKKVLKDNFKVEAQVMPYSFVLPENSIQQFERKSSDSIQILQPTRFANWKGSHFSLKLICDLEKEGYKLNFVHAGINKTEFEKKWDPRWNLQFPGLKENVKHLIKNGRVSFIKYPPTDVYSVFNKFDYIIHPTTGREQYGDPNPLAVQQAVINNKYLLTSNSGNIPYIIRNYKKCVVSEANNYPDLLKKVRQVLRKHPRLLELDDAQVAKDLHRQIVSSPRLHYKYYDSISGRI
jgi:glycosyltransferase involved in cell wall biosynthesis